MRNEEQTTILCLRVLVMALSEPIEMKKKWKTDTIGIALQFGGSYRPKLKREHFEIIQDKTINELIETLRIH